jgi:hypothetical protein
MSDSRAQAPSRLRTPRCPFLLVDILKLLGVWKLNIDEAGEAEVDEVLSWLCHRIHEVTGVPRADVAEFTRRLAKHGGVEGSANSNHVSSSLAYQAHESIYDRILWERDQWEKRDLCYIPPKLRELDKDGTTARWWRTLHSSQPLIRRFYQLLLDAKVKSAGSAVLTAEDKAILTVLSLAGLALTFAQIAMDAAEIRRKQRDVPGMMLLSERKIRERVPLLEERGLVSRPSGKDGKPTKRKGVGITAKGLAWLTNNSPAPR